MKIAGHLAEAGPLKDVGLTLLHERRFDEAVDEFQKAAELSGGNRKLMALLGCAYGISGNTEAAMRVLKGLEERAKSVDVSSIDFALLFIGLGDYDRAFEHLDRAYHQRDGEFIWLAVSALYDPVRSDPRYGALLKRVGLTEERARSAR